MTTQPQPQPDPYSLLQIELNPDGSLTRKINFPTTKPSPTYDPTDPIPVLTQDINFDPSNDVAWFRIYLPHRHHLAGGAKLPVVFYFHGGGFIFCSPDSEIFHPFVSGLAGFLPAVVVSVKYRLAPEHRLPAAYDDAVRALHWIKTHWAHLDWLRDHADLSNCFVMGTSAGGNMAHHVGPRVAHDLEPIKIRGLILHHPFFGGTQRTAAELRLADDPILPLSCWDLMWQLSLPVGSDRDHEFCNPTAGGDSDDVAKVTWRVLVTGYEGDPLYDRQKAVAKMLESKGVSVESVFKEGGKHGLELSDTSAAMQLYTDIKKFITK